MVSAVPTPVHCCCFGTHGVFRTRNLAIISVTGLICNIGGSLWPLTNNPAHRLRLLGHQGGSWSVQQRPQRNPTPGTSHSRYIQASGSSIPCIQASGNSDSWFPCSPLQAYHLFCARQHQMQAYHCPYCGAHGSSDIAIR